MEQSVQISPLKQANDFANSAEAAAERGDIETSCTLHFRAAELFLLAINDTKDPEVFCSNKAVKTLKLLYASHTRTGKELQRRISTLPKHRPLPVVAQPKPIHQYQMKEQVNPRPTLINPMAPQIEKSMNRNYSGEANIQDVSNQMNFVNQSYSSQSNSIAQSYMILDHNRDDFRHENEDDPFNKFWDAIEGLGIKTSGPVAFTTAPLGDMNEEIQSPIEELSPTNILKSYMVIPPPKKSNSGFDQEKTNEEYRLENKQLKEMVDMLSKKVAMLERAQNENNMLKSSIIQFRQEYQKQQRVNNPLMKSINDKRRMPLSQSVMMPNNQSYENEKIKQLEQELQKANIQNELHVKKWEKLKETARKKRELKSSILTESGSIASELPPVSPPLGKAAASSNPVSPLGGSPKSPSQSIYYSVNSHA